MRDGRAALDVARRVAAFPLRRRAGARRRTPRRPRRREIRRARPSSRREVLAELRQLIPLAPLHQPHNLAAIEAVSRAAAGRPAGRLLRHELSPRAGRPSPSSCRCRATSARPACSVTASTGSRTSTSPPCCRRWRRRSPTARVIVAHLGSGASLCAMKNAQERRSARSASRRSTGSAWARGPAPLDPGRHPPSCSRRSASPPKKWRRSSTRSRDCSASRGSATTCAICSTAPSRAARLAVDYFVYRAAKEIGALAAVLGGIDGLVFTAGIGENSAEIRRRICEVVRLARHRAGRRGERQEGAAHLHGRQPRPGLGDSHQRRTDDRAAHRRAARADRSSRLAGGSEEVSMSCDRVGDASERSGGLRLAGVSNRPVAEGNQRPRLHPAELHAVRRRRRPSSRPPRLGHRRSGTRCRTCSSRSGARSSSTSPRSRARSPPTRPATSIASTKSSSGSRPMLRSSARSCRTAVSASCSTRSRPTATSPIRMSSRRSPSIGRPTTMRCSTPTRRISGSAAARTFSPGLPDAYGRGRIIGDTGGCLSMELTG